ncbi:zinc-dependent alcohol dehydrogenase [Nesterenkonia aerolata]|uniref:Alcohol dehydrogenase catalytic domain-containing protein n=1 Tax=Nesterenkonia aerolata TaxID=3074079 RepID=A0ABU2DUI4_9MICC|nr:alcohol dehydrogenase catalytic domain-containing protein [Nesterenkonia sp. LY-0111]MDR8019945.1 alcohol dehydrogenase catalytic domain-containing protein [Nesterenkonia sp. LY-0111]
MRAAVLTAPETVELTTVPDPVPDVGEVLVRMRAVGLCGSDLGVWSGARAVPEMPWIMGHEGGGEVVAVGVGVDPGRVGEQVVIEPNYPCLECEACASGTTSVCPRRGILGMNMPGLLAELVAVPEQFVHSVTGVAASTEALAVIEPTAVARAATAVSEVPSGADVLVTGAGSQGLLVIQLLVAAGAKPWVMELDIGRRALARELGAVGVEDASAPAKFSHVIDAVGTSGLWQVMLPKVAAPVTVTVIGMSEDPLPLTTKQITRGRMTLRGTIIYDHPHDFEQAVAAVGSGEIDPQAILTEATPFSEAGEAFASASSARGKTWIRFD